MNIKEQLEKMYTLKTIHFGLDNGVHFKYLYIFMITKINLTFHVIYFTSNFAVRALLRPSYPQLCTFLIHFEML